MTKKKAHRRQRVGPELERLLELQFNLETGVHVHAVERRWLAKLLGDVAGDVDVRERFFESVAARPKTVTNRDLWLAVDYRLRVAAGDRSVQKKVANDWNIPGSSAPAHVKRIARENRAAADELIQTTKTNLQRVVARHRRRAGTLSQGA